MWYSALLLIILTAIVVYDLKKRRKERAEYKKAELLKGKNGADYMKEPVTLTPSGVVSRKIAEAAKREKRVIRTIVIFWSALFLSLLAFVLCGTYSKACSFNQFWKNEFVYGDFVCQMPDDKEFVQIAGLSEAGKRKNTLVVSASVRGVRVTQILDRARRNRENRFASDELETLYLPDVVINMRTDGFPRLRSVYAANPENTIGCFSSDVKIYICDEFYSFYSHRENTDMQGLARANVVFSANITHSGEDVLWVSGEAYGGLIRFVPEDPVLDGYAFEGWYKDERGREKWDFSSDRMPFPAFWQAGEKMPYHQIYLYAKWRPV